MSKEQLHSDTGDKTTYNVSSCRILRYSYAVPQSPSEDITFSVVNRLVRIDQVLHLENANLTASGANLCCAVVNVVVRAARDEQKIRVGRWDVQRSRDMVRLSHAGDDVASRSRATRFGVVGVDKDIIDRRRKERFAIRSKGDAMV